MTEEIISPREIATREALSHDREDYFTGSSLHLRTWRSVVRGKGDSYHFKILKLTHDGPHELNLSALTRFPEPF